jgi:hypothetical protein
MAENFNDRVSALIDAVKDGAYTDRDERLTVISGLIDEYVKATGETPDSAQLERLADLCMREELTDMSTWKARHAEYPVFSAWQLDVRSNRDSSPPNAENDDIDSEGRNRGKPIRRKRSKREHRHVNKFALNQNRARKRKYNEFTKTQPVVERQIKPVDIDAYLREKYTFWQRKYA